MVVDSKHAPRLRLQYARVDPMGPEQRAAAAVEGQSISASIKREAEIADSQRRAKNSPPHCEPPERAGSRLLSEDSDTVFSVRPTDTRIVAATIAT
jgi:hypothetical protein